MKNLHKIFSKPKYYFIFPVVVAALFSTSLINVPCPIDGGTGMLSQSVGMENLRVVSIESRVISSEQDHCTNYIVTRANPIITITNSGTQTANGYLKLRLVDLNTGKVLTSQNMAIEVGPNALTVLQSYVAFAYNTIDRAPEDMGIQVDISLDNIPCVVSNGTGRVSLSTYLLAKFYKNNLVSTVKSQQQYSKDPWEGSKAWMDWMELS